MSSNEKVLKTFFRCLGIGFVISCVKTDYRDLGPLEVVSTLFLTFMFNFVVGISAGLTSIFLFIGKDIYFFIKKKQRNEGHWYLPRLIGGWNISI